MNRSGAQSAGGDRDCRGSGFPGLRHCAAPPLRSIEDREPPQAAGKVLNIGTGERRTLNQTFAALCRITGVRLDPIYEAPRHGDIMHSHADIGLAREILGYEPTVGFEAGLARTVNWYRRASASNAMERGEEVALRHD